MRAGSRHHHRRAPSSPSRRCWAKVLAALAFIGLGSPAVSRAESFFSAFRDPDDGGVDLSEWLLDRKGFLPAPIVITEPAVGYGGGLALAFFRESIAEAVARSEAAGHLQPPDIFGGAFAATENGTKFAGAGAMLTFGDDEFRRQVQADTGIKPQWAAESFDDVDGDVRQSIARIEASPFIPKKDSIRGFVYDVETGRLREVS